MKQLEHGYVLQRAKCSRCFYEMVKDQTFFGMKEQKDTTFFGLKERLFKDIQTEHQVVSPNCDGRLTIIYDNAVREEE